MQIKVSQKIANSKVYPTNNKDHNMSPHMALTFLPSVAIDFVTKSRK